MIEIVRMILGPLMTNAYLVGEVESGKAVIIDPAWDGELIAQEARRRNWQIEQVWLTHAHFDHMGGLAGIARSVQPTPSIAIHPGDQGLYSMQGGAAFFGFRIEAGPEPTILLKDRQIVSLDMHEFEVRHSPGHTPGHVVLFDKADRLAFCGDVIFSGSIGRTDLPGGDYDTLMDSIRMQILTLPNDTRLLTGHGDETTVGVERRDNPFLL